MSEEGRTVSVLQADYMLLYYDLEVEEWREAYFVKERLQIVKDNLIRGVVNISENGSVPEDRKIKYFRLYKSEMPVAQYTGDYSD